MTDPESGTVRKGPGVQPLPIVAFIPSLLRSLPKLTAREFIDRSEEFLLTDRYDEDHDPDNYYLEYRILPEE